ncbi:Dolichyl-phosphate-mannose--protein mannosyltransferase 6 [Astathelohania contejeani]|uniref:Dolichyl-phosphate-mannose--protein mannosyltransferase 6 n=1 Tax=Astathelohania contejeani TaxID=164912 RepID=A0ABQ7HXY9_9MICR|nr:Dolichyl-phosphate-mannose--protein mannosyltransferase 6 [Thelohania contejeani]
MNIISYFLDTIKLRNILHFKPTAFVYSIHPPLYNSSILQTINPILTVLLTYIFLSRHIKRDMAYIIATISSYLLVTNNSDIVTILLFLCLGNRWPFITGFYAGICFSCSWGATYPIILIGSLIYLFNFSINPKNNYKRVLVYALKIIFAFFILPCGIYLLAFYYKFKIESKISPHIDRFSWDFKVSFMQHHPTSCYVIDGSEIALLNKHTQAYLSESNEITLGSNQKVIFGSKTPEIWKLIKIHVVEDGSPESLGEDARYIQNGDYIKIRNLKTGNYLHSHAIETQTSRENKFYEVTGFGPETDDNDYWKIEFVNTDDSIHRNDKHIMIARKTVFRLKHVRTGYDLSARITKKGVEIHGTVEGLKISKSFIITDNIVGEHLIEHYNDSTLKEKITEYTKLKLSEIIWEYHTQMYSDYKKSKFDEYSEYLHVFGYLVMFFIGGLINRVLFLRYQKGVRVSWDVWFLFWSFTFNFIFRINPTELLYLIFLIEIILADYILKAAYNVIFK